MVVASRSVQHSPLGAPQAAGSLSAASLGAPRAEGPFSTCAVLSTPRRAAGARRLAPPLMATCSAALPTTAGAVSVPRAEGSSPL
eukprot:3754150-Pyramimonas_sp.AAC.1